MCVCFHAFLFDVESPKSISETIARLYFLNTVSEDVLKHFLNSFEQKAVFRQSISSFCFIFWVSLLHSDSGGVSGGVSRACIPRGAALVT